MTSELLVFLGDHEVGRLTRDAAGSLTFTYEDAWLAEPNAHPLSLSMPLVRRVHTGDLVAAYLWGLLPDNEIILDAWAKRFKVSARNPFALIANVGEDCPGAVRFVTASRRAKLAKEGRGAIDWLDEHDVAERLRALHRDVSAWREPTDSGQFSLGGAQPKTALFFDGKRWGIPSGRLPTTHILKSCSPELAGHAENEHFCLMLAGRATACAVAGESFAVADRSRITESAPLRSCIRFDRLRMER